MNAFSPTYISELSTTPAKLVRKSFPHVPMRANSFDAFLYDAWTLEISLSICLTWAKTKPKQTTHVNGLSDDVALNL